MLYFQNPSWLSFQQKMQDNNGGNNAISIFGIKVPTENHSKNLLDKLKPEVFKKVYDDILLERERLAEIGKWNHLLYFMVFLNLK